MSPNAESTVNTIINFSFSFTIATKPNITIAKPIGNIINKTFESVPIVKRIFFFINSN